MWILIYFEQLDMFKWLLTFAFFSDAIDGYIARRLNQVTKLGSMLDSYGDSLTILSGLAGLIRFRFDLYEAYGLVMIIVLSLHLVQLSLSLWRYGKPSSFHTYSAKLGAVAIGVFILTSLHFDFFPWLFYTTVVILIIDAIEESILVYLIPQWKTDVKGIFWLRKKRNLPE